jgi:hypothetical protein
MASPLTPYRDVRAKYDDTVLQFKSNFNFKVISFLQLKVVFQRQHQYGDINQYGDVRFLGNACIGGKFLVLCVVNLLLKENLYLIYFI